MEQKYLHRPKELKNEKNFTPKIPQKRKNGTKIAVFVCCFVYFFVVFVLFSFKKRPA